jgi:hypothetical protein
MILYLQSDNEFASGFHISKYPHFCLLTPNYSLGTLNSNYRVGFEVLTAVSTKMAVFWIVAPCSLVEVYQRFRGPCCLHHQGDDDGGSKVH